MAPFSWNFVGAYPVIFAVAVGVSAAIYNSTRFMATSPDFRFSKTLRTDAAGEEESLITRAKAYRPNFFRYLGESRTIEKGGAGGSDTRVFRV